MVEFTISGKASVEQLGKLSKLTGRCDQINVFVHKNNLISLQTSTDLRAAAAQLVAKVAKPGKFAVARDMLEGILRNRNQITMQVKNNQLFFKAADSSYSGKNIPLLDTAAPLSWPDKGLAIPAKLQAKLLQQFAAVALTPSIKTTTGTAEAIAAHLAVRKEQLIIAAADDLHAAIVSGELTTKFNLKEISIPSEYAALMPLFSADNLSLHIDSASIVLQNSELKAKLPALQLGRIDLDIILQTLNNNEKPAVKLSIDSNTLKSALQNLEIASNNNADVLLETKNQKLFLHNSSNFGSVTDAIEVSKTTGQATSMLLDINSLQDALSKLSGKVQLSLFSPTRAELTKKIADGVHARYVLSAKQTPEATNNKKSK